MSLIETTAKYTQKSVPLIDVEVTGSIIECFGKINVRQTYQNLSENKIEATYIFPLDLQSVITDFNINIDDERKLAGVLKRKDIAKQEYQKAINTDKKTACYLEQDSTGTYKVKVGNINPNQKIIIEYTYLNTLNITQDENRAYRFVLPTNIAPKYELGGQQTFTKLTHTDDITKLHKIRINLSIESKANILSVESYSHKNKLIETKQTNPEVTNIDEDDFNIVEVVNDKYNIQIQTSPLEGDFNLIIQTDNNNYPLVYKTTDAEDTFFMFVHKIKEQEQVANKDSFSEYIFFIDRSGSMHGDKMTRAKETINLAIKSLPVGCRFNIVSFGTGHMPLWSESKEYTNENITHAISNVNTFEADLGGTEILTPIKKYTDVQTEIKHKRIFILITDGQVENEALVMQTVKNKKSQDRFFTIGIGHDASRALVENIALNGHGNSQMVVDNNDIKGAIIKLLDESSKEYLHHVKLDASSQLNSHMILTMNRDYIIPNNPFLLFAKINSVKFAECAVTDIKLEALDTINNVVNWNMQLATNENNPDVKQLYGKYMINNMINGNSHYHKLDFNHEKITDLITDMSLKYNILSPYTSFIVVDTMEATNTDLPLETVNVPHYSTQSIHGIQGIQGPIGVQGGSGPTGGCGYFANNNLTNSVMLCSGYNTLSSYGNTFSMAPQSMQSSANTLQSRSIMKCMESSKIESCDEEDNDFDGFDGLECMEEKLSSMVYEKKKKSNILSSVTSSLKNFTGNLFSKSTNSLALVAPTTTKDITQYQNADGSFISCNEIYTIINIRKDQIVKFSSEQKLDIHLCLQIYVLDYLQKINDDVYKLITKKLIAHIDQQLNKNTTTKSTTLANLIPLVNK